MKKRLFATALALVMLVGLLPTAVFAVENTYVAAIGDAKYETLIEAVNAAKAGETITVLKDFDIADDKNEAANTTYPMADGVTLDLNNHTVGIRFTRAIFTGSNITIQNGTIQSPAGKTNDYVLYIGNGSAETTAKVKNVTCVGGININRATVTLEDVTATAKASGSLYTVVALSSSDVTILSGTYTNSNSKKQEISKELAATVTLYGGTFANNPTVSYCAHGYTVIENSDKYVVVGIVQGTSAYYPTLQAAVDAGETNLTLLAGMDEDFVIEEDANTDFTLNLGAFKLESTITVHHKIHTVKFNADENNQSVIYLTDPAGAHDPFEKWCTGNLETQEEETVTKAENGNWVVIPGKTYHPHFGTSGLTEIGEEDRHLYFTKTAYGYVVGDALTKSFEFEIKDNAPESFAPKIIAIETPTYFDVTYTGLAVTVKPKAGLPVGEYEEKIYITVDEGDDKTSSHELIAFFEVTKADSTVTPSASKTEYEYGDIITLTATITKGDAVAQAALDEVEFFCGTTLLGTAQVAYAEESNATCGTATLTHDTTTGNLVIGSHTITAVYGGSINLNGSQSDSVNITLNAKTLSEEDTFTIGDTNITGPATVTPDGVTVQGGGQIGDIKIPEDVTVTVPSDKLDEVFESEGVITVPKGSTIKVGEVTVEVKSEGVTVDSQGNITVPSGSEIKIGDTIITGPASVGQQGNVTIEPNGKIDNGDNGSYTVPAGTEITIPSSELDDVTTTTEGVTTLPEGTVITKGEDTITVTDGNVEIKADGTVTIPNTATVTTKDDVAVTGPASVDADGDITVSQGGVITKGNETITVETGSVTVGDNGKVDIQSTATVSTNDGVKVTGPATVDTETGEIAVTNGTVEINGTTITGSVTVDEDGKVTVKDDTTVQVGNTSITGPATVEKNVDSTGEDDAVNVTVGGGGSINSQKIPDGTTVTVPAGKVDEVANDSDGNTVLPEGSTITNGDVTVDVKEGNVTVDDKGNIIVSENSKVEIGGTEITGPASVEDGDVQVEAGGKIDGIELPPNTTISVPTDKLDEVEANTTGTIIVPPGSTVTSNGKDYVVSGSGATVKPDGSVASNSPIFIPVAPGGGSTPETPTTPTVTVSGNTATVTLPEGMDSAVITIPYDNAEGMVVCDAETKEIIPFCVSTEEGIKVLVNGDCTLEIVNNNRNFTDIDDHWAKTFIDFVTERELYDGMTTTTFGPEYKMTQAMLIVVLAGMDGNEASGDDWYTWAFQWGIENDIFEVKDTTTEMTREDFALMLFNYAKKLGLDIAIRADLSVFPDADEISANNLTAMQWAVAAGLMEGRTDGTIDPTASATRAEVAVMLMQFIYYAVS